MTARRTLNLIPVAVLALLAMVVLAAPSAEAAHPNAGYIYGTVTTRSGNTYTGILRWNEDEEAFWDDLFQSAKQDVPWAERYGEDPEKVEDNDDDWGDGWRWLRIFGRRIQIEFGEPSRIFIARFGDIAKIEVTGRDDARLTMRSGTDYDVSGYANDVGGTVFVRDQSLGDIALPWRKIDTIVFQPTPDDVKPVGRRLKGTVATDDGDFSGFIQWDSEECLTTDELDGDADDGRLSIKMGRIASIERRSRRSSKVTLRDGRTLVLDGTNDVDSSIRGILVEDPRFGRVEIPWQAFRRADFDENTDSGRGYQEYEKGHGLRGTVTDHEGKKWSGDLVFDLDESETWEMLNGDSWDIEYNIPFELVAAIERTGHDSSRVTLRNGEKLDLEDGQDVSDRNDGMLIIGKDKDNPKVIRWRDVDRVDFEK